MKNKTYTDNQIEWLKKYFDAELKSVRAAVDKEAETSKVYRENQNEWRGTIKDQQAVNVTKGELYGWAIATVTFLLAGIGIIMAYLK